MPTSTGYIEQLKRNNEYVDIHDIDLRNTIDDVLTTSTTNITGNPINIIGLKSNQLAVNPIITFEPIQDLHGLSNSYPAGTGKNLIPMTVDGIKALNTTGTWNGNNYTLNNVTFTLNTDADNNIISIRANASQAASANALLQFGKYALPSGSYRLENNFTNDKAYVEWYPKANTASSDSVSFSVSDSNTRDCYIAILSGYTPSNLVFKPLIRLASQPSGFEPYTNICSISGYDNIYIQSCEKNILNGEKFADEIISKVSSSSKDSTTKTVTYNSSLIANKIFDTVKFKPDTQYTFYLSVISGSYSNLMIVYTDGSNTQIGINNYIVSAAGKSIKYIQGLWVQGNTTLDYANSGIFEGTVNSFISYKPITQISDYIGQTMYGGSLDIRTGILTINKGIKVFNGTETWATYDGGYYINQNDFNLPLYQDISNSITNSFVYNGSPVSGQFRPVSGTNCYMPLFKYNNVSDVNEWKTYLQSNNIQFVYPLTTPFTIQLTPHEISLLKDYAYVSTNGTSIALDYHNGEIATLGDVSQLNEVVEGMNSKFITVFGTIGDTVNVEKVIPFPNGINPAKFIYLGYVAHNTNGYWYSNNSEIIIFTASNMGIRVKTSNTYFLNQTIKIFGVLVP